MKSLYFGNIFKAPYVLKKHMDMQDSFRTLLLCIWFDKDTLPCSINNQTIHNNCLHIGTELGKSCKRCGSWYGLFGTENSFITFMEHFYLFMSLVSKFVDRVIVKSSFSIVTDYEQKLTKQKIPYRYVRQHVMYSSIIPSSSIHRRVDNCRFVNVYDKTSLPKDILSPCFYFPSLSVFELFNCRMLIVNPDKFEMNDTILRDYLVCNNNILNEIQSENYKIHTYI